jgi:hypothetical protein
MSLLWGMASGPFVFLFVRLWQKRGISGHCHFASAVNTSKNG